MPGDQRFPPARLAGLSLALLWPLLSPAANAEGDDSRPTIKANRWQEDWSALASPALRTEPLDDLKYIALGTDSDSYLSLGATLRERLEMNNAPGFGTKGVARDNYLLQRFQVHADLHLNEHWRVFTQLEDARAYDKTTLGGADQNRLDLRLAFLEYINTFDSSTFKTRVGRQDFAFDLQRFVSSRDGPNVRQSFDAVWADWETAQWRFIGLASHPVQYRDDQDFDDTSSKAVRFDMLRVERMVGNQQELSAYYALYQQDHGQYLDAAGAEHRDIIDGRYAGTANQVDWDVEGMLQSGSVGPKDIRAWAAGSRIGYTFADQPWAPRLGLQLDIASGDSHAGDGRLGTFNPLFPNGYYFTLAGYTGYSNLIHVKPSLTVKPLPGLSIQTAIGLLWRQTTADAVYTQPSIAVANTAGTGQRWTGAYAQLRTDYAFTANLSGAVEAVHYDVGQTLRDAGSHDSNYLGVELKFSW